MPDEFSKTTTDQPAKFVEPGVTPTEASPAQHALCNLLGMEIVEYQIFQDHSSPRTFEALMKWQPPRVCAIVKPRATADDPMTGTLYLDLEDSPQTWQGHIELYLKEGY